MKNYNKLGCFPNQMGDTISWLNIEIWVFWINISILGLYVLQRKYSSLDSIKTSHDIWTSIVNQELLEFYSSTYKKHEENLQCGKENEVNRNHIWVVDGDNIEHIE